MKGEPHISPVWKLVRSGEPDQELESWSRIERLRRQAWREHGILTVRPEELPDGMKITLVAWAEENYGTRKA